MMLSPAYNDLTRLVMPKGKRENIDSSAAITKYRVLDSNYGVSLVECQPITGKFHSNFLKFHRACQVKYRFLRSLRTSAGIFFPGPA
jgi:hypothetical protein